MRSTSCGTTTSPSGSASWRSIAGNSTCPRMSRRRLAGRARPRCPPSVSQASADERWFAEPPFAGIQQRYRVLGRLHAETTPWQTLEVLDLEGPGRALILAGTLQTSVGEEFTYHEPLVHIPLFAHPNPHRVLIIGGGDGGALRHVLMHSSVHRALEVEIDH